VGANGQLGKRYFDFRAAHMNEVTDRQTKGDRPEGGLFGPAAAYILSSVFFVDFDLAIFFLLVLSFDISALDMLSLWAAGPVVAGPFVSVD